MMTLLYFVVALGILVLIHEWGHFIVARRSGIRVEQFSIGFGPKLFGIKRGETEYKISLIPLGGYVKLYGEDPVAEADGDEEKASEIASSPHAFSAKPLRSRFITVLAGPIMNLVLCVLLMPVVFMIGRMIPAILEKEPVIIGIQDNSPAQAAGFAKGDRILEINHSKVGTWSDVLNWIILHPDTESEITIERGGTKLSLPLQVIDSPDDKQKMGYVGFEPNFFWGNEPIVGEITAGSPAEKAGLKLQDRITKIGGQDVATWTEMSALIRAGEGKETTLTILRDEKEELVSIQPTFHEGSGVYIIGITKFMDPNFYVKKKYSFFEAITEGMKECGKLFRLTGEVLGRLFTFNLSYKALGGPVQIAQATGAAARSGIGEFMYFVAFLSMQLGILNLLPIPVLDGGHVLFMVLEGIRRKPVSLKVRSALTSFGLIFLLSLMILITFNDVDRIWGFKDIWGSIKGIF